MKNILAKQLINKILKIADMPPTGGSWTKTRTQEHGLKFKIFNRSSAKQKMLDLPEDIKQNLAQKIDSFYNEFAKYLTTDQEKRNYAGMIRIAFAKDTHVTPEVLGDLEKNFPTLVETAKFIDQYNIQLNPETETLVSRLPKDVAGTIIHKNIGSDHWFSIYGYAYMDLQDQGFPFNVKEF
jgi:hypothetical protein